MTNLLLIFVFSLLFVISMAGEFLMLRVRLPNGITKRIDVKGSDPLRSIEDQMKQFGNFNLTSSIRSYKWNDLILRMTDPEIRDLEVNQCGFKPGDLLIAISDVMPRSNRNLSKIWPNYSQVRPHFGSVKDFVEDSKAYGVGSMPVVVGKQLYPLLEKICDNNNIAILLGTTPGPDGCGGSSTAVEAVCIIPGDRSWIDPSTMSAQTKDFLALVSQLAKDSNHHIVGCAIGSSLDSFCGDNPVERTNKKEWWALDHVLKGLTLSQYATNQTDFTILM